MKKIKLLALLICTPLVLGAQNTDSLGGNHDIETVEVRARQSGNFIQQSAIAKKEVISFGGLCKMACCNLAESFENSASVTVGYSDAISGARQIRMLGLTGTYTQMLDESRPIMRGLSAPYALSYTPGMWLNSIQVSKGISSVTAGREAVTGQINLEHRKPTDDERLFLNLFLNSELRPEVNLTSAFPVNKSGSLSTVFLLHASGDTGLVEMDENGDGYRDMPHSNLYTLANRWCYFAPNGMQLRWGGKLLTDSRLGGSVDYQDDMRGDMLSNNIYGSLISNRGANGYFKLGMPVGRAKVDEYGVVTSSNFALVVDFDHFVQDSYFGLNDYRGEENSLVANAMYNHYFTPSSSLVLGATAQFNIFDERLHNDVPWLNSSNTFDLSRQEGEVGAYAEYNFQHGDNISIIAGLRGDYNSYYERFMTTPRGQIRWSITPTTTLRGSAGLGYRNANVITDNIGMLATGREIIFEDGTSQSFNRVESALTYGASLTQQISILNERDATLSVDYFRTGFFNEVVVDQEMDMQSIHIYSSTMPSTTDSYQVDFMWQPNTHWDIFATFRYTDSEMTLKRADGTTYSAERPLVSRFKTLLNLQYATHMRRWVFDATAQLNGKSRLPSLDGEVVESPIYPVFFAQVSRRVGKWELYFGCENIADYRQPNPILGAENPFSSEFNSSVVWAPLSGRKFYFGTRFNLY